MIFEEDFLLFLGGVVIGFVIGYLFKENMEDTKGEVGK